jgi:hypothetical protein
VYANQNEDTCDIAVTEDGDENKFAVTYGSAEYLKGNDGPGLGEHTYTFTVEINDDI